MSKVGTLIHTARTQQGRTLADVAAAAKLSLPYLWEIEQGKKMGSPAALRRLASVLGISEQVVYDAYIEHVRREADCKWFQVERYESDAVSIGVV